MPVWDGAFACCMPFHAATNLLQQTFAVCVCGGHTKQNPLYTAKPLTTGIKNCSGSSPCDYGSSRSTHEPNLLSSTVQVHRSAQYRIFAVHFCYVFFWIYIYNIYVYIHLYILVFICKLIEVYIYIDICIYICIYIRIYIYIYSYISKNVYIHHYLYIYISIYIQHCGAGILSWTGSWLGIMHLVGHHQLIKHI